MGICLLKWILGNFEEHVQRFNQEWALWISQSSRRMMDKKGIEDVCVFHLKKEKKVIWLHDDEHKGNGLAKVQVNKANTILLPSINLNSTFSKIQIQISLMKEWRNLAKSTLLLLLKPLESNAALKTSS